MNAASETTKAMSQGFVFGFQSWSACVSVAEAALIPIPYFALPVRLRFWHSWIWPKDRGCAEQPD
jgi:hypothetical protein